MPNAAAAGPSISPSEMVLEMVNGILGSPKMDLHKKLDELRELSLERISFDSPEQAERIIRGLAEVIATDPSPEIRVAALEAMERMIALEEKAEAEKDAPPINWRTVNVLLNKAKEQTDLDRVPVASRDAVPSLETPSSKPLSDAPLVGLDEDLQPEAHALSSDDNLGAEETALFSAQAAAVQSLRDGNPAIEPPSLERLSETPPSEVSTPAPTRALNPASPITGVTARGADAPAHASPGADKSGAPAQKGEPPIMKFLRVVADTDNEEHIRALAHRVIANIENMTSLKQAPVQTPSATQG